MRAPPRLPVLALAARALSTCALAACALAACALAACALAACAVAPSEMPDADHLVAVKGVRIPSRSWLPWYARFADHLWIDVKSDGGWRRVEWNSRLTEVRVRPLDPEAARADTRWGMQVRVHDILQGPGVREVARSLLAIAPRFPYRDEYMAWPGPNSNTFIAWLARETPGLCVDLPATAVGKDYATWLRAGLTTSRTGLEFDTMLLGAEVGLREGVEVHFLGLVVGVGLWPPAIKLPFLPELPFGVGRRGSAGERP